MRKILLMLFAILTAGMTAGVAVAADTVYVIRHLQKATGADPPLSEIGAANARLLAERLAKSGIKAIFATPTKRAMETAQPLAQKLHVSITSYDPREPAALVGKVARVNGAALVVGHSNTVPELVAAFGGSKPGSLTEQDYGTIFVVKSGSAAVQEVELSRPAN